MDPTACCPSVSCSLPHASRWCLAPQTFAGPAGLPIDMFWGCLSCPCLRGWHTMIPASGPSVDGAKTVKDLQWQGYRSSNNRWYLVPYNPSPAASRRVLASFPSILLQGGVHVLRFWVAVIGNGVRLTGSLKSPDKCKMGLDTATPCLKPLTARPSYPIYRIYFAALALNASLSCYHTVLAFLTQQPCHTGWL